MKVSWNWLGEFVELEWSVERVAERLAMSGLEVESIEQRGRELGAVLVAEVVQVERHPGADRLSVCTIRVEAEQTIRVVCGAPNVRAGLHVPYAAPGVQLPNGKRIEAAEIRGVASAGMLCSEVELGLGPDESGLLILPSDAVLGDSIAKLLDVDDVVLDIAITPNRGDCASVLGVAREISALTGQRLRRPRVSVTESAQHAAEILRVKIEDPELCGRYVARLIHGVKIGPSPLSLQYRLRSVGIRPHNNVVDVTNFVMIERGQPLHAFDAQRLPAAEITVRRAGSAMKYTTLDGQERDLEADDLLITSGGRAVALAGIMGGADSEVIDSTQQILLESACFAPSRIRRTAKRLGLRSEASFRFERGIDIEAVATAADRAAALIVRYAGGKVAAGRVDEYPGAQPVAPIALRLARVGELLGMEIAKPDVVSQLKALGMSVTPATRGTLTVVPPSYRTDITREIDVIEEIVRMVGYDNVPTTMPEAALAGEGLDVIERCYREIRRLLSASGLSEAIPYTFCSPRLNRLFPPADGARVPVAILNPMSGEESEMRLSVLAALVRALKLNVDQAAGHVALFTLGKVFWSDATTTGVYGEAMHLALAVHRGIPMAGVGTREQQADFFDVKGIVESLLESLRVSGVTWEPAADVTSFHPGKTARVLINGQSVGVIGALHPDLADELNLDASTWLVELDLENLLTYCPPRVGFKELPRFPVVMRDLAVMAEAQFASDEVVRFVREWPETVALIEGVQLFDQYSGAPIPEGKKSLAFSVAYRAADRTLTDVEVNELHGRLVHALTMGLGLEQR